MFKKATILYLYTETPLHAGSGTSLGLVDLPIQRERTTQYPIIQASGLKGSLRQEAKAEDQTKVSIVFGPDPKNGPDYAGALSVGDARVLLFPVRSLKGVFAWATSRDVLARFKRDACTAGISVNWTVPVPQGSSEALIASDTIVTNGRVVLEEFAFDAKQEKAVVDEVIKIARWLKENALPLKDYDYWQNALCERLVILPEDAFRDFTQFSTEVITRVRLDEKKTVERGALWSEEHLPSDTLLYAPLFANDPRVDNAPEDLKSADAVLDFVEKRIPGRIQLGGDGTVGRGLVATRMGG